MPSLNQFISSYKQVTRTRNIYNKTKVLSTYLSLAIKKTFLSSKAKKLKPGFYKLLGNNVNYISFNTLFFLYNEIFIGLEYYFKTDKKHPFIIDCGSNMGMSILFYKFIYPESEIIGFEPDIFAYKMLSKNVSENNLSNTIVHQKALTDTDGTIDFFYDPDNTSALHMSIMEERESKSKVQVDCTRLSTYIDKPVDFLKLDIEGAESLVIKDLDENEKLKFIHEMVIEYHHHINKEEDNLSEMLAVLEDNNFGYQITAKTDMPHTRRIMQDIIIYAYKK